MSRSVLVTGANRGIGLAIARAFAEQGDRVAVTHRGTPPPDGSGLLPVVCDVTSQESVDAAFTAAEEAHGPVEVVVSNAGRADDTLLAMMAEDRWAGVIDANLSGAYRVARRAVRPMIKLRRGRLIFVGSAMGLLGGAGQANYSASKAGLVGLARSLARELGSRGITSNVVAPGWVDTDMTAELSDDLKTRMLAQVPLGRTATADEVAAVVTFLASEAAGYVTGAIVPVDGGLGMGH